MTENIMTENTLYEIPVILEIARGDSIGELLAAGIVEPRKFHCMNGDPIDGYAAIGGTLVRCPVISDGNRGGNEYIDIPGVGRKMRNVYGIAHGQRQIYRQHKSGCELIGEVFIG